MCVQDMNSINSHDDSDHGPLQSLLANDVPTGLISRPKQGNKVLLPAACVASFCVYSLVSAVAPFFPQYAQEYLGADSMWVGVVIAAFPLTSMVASPAVGVMCTRLGRGPVLFVGCIILAVGTGLFGVAPTLTLSIMARIVQGVAASMVNISITALLMQSDVDLASALATEEVFVGVGFVVGPALGGILYSVGGFTLTFVMLAAFPAGFAVACPWVLRAAGVPFWDRDNSRGSRILSDGRRERSCSITSVNSVNSDRGWQAEKRVWKRVLLNRTVVTCSVTICIGFAALGFMDPTMSEHLELTLDSTPWITGLMFSAPSLLYAVGAYVAVSVSNSIGYKHTMTMGFIITALSLWGLGPAPFLTFLFVERWISWALFIGSLLIFGLGIAFMWIPCLPAMQHSLHHGPTTGRKFKGRDFDRADDALSSVFNLSNSGGEVLGPLLGAYMVDHVKQVEEVTCHEEDCQNGFIWASFIYGVILLGCAAAIAIFIPSDAPQDEDKVAEVVTGKHDHYEPLLLDREARVGSNSWHKPGYASTNGESPTWVHRAPSNGGRRGDHAVMFNTANQTEVT